MNTDWKARLHMLWKRGDAYTLIPLISIVLGTAMAAFGTILFNATPPWMPWKMILTCYGISAACVYTYFLKELLFQKHHYLDEYIARDRKIKGYEKKKKEKEAAEKRNKEKLKHIQRVATIAKSRTYNREESEMLQNACNTMSTIIELSNDYQLAVEDEHILLQTIPNDIADILNIYFSMPSELKNVQRQEVETFIKHKKDEIENTWKAKFHGNLTFELQKKLAVAKTRQR